MGSAVRTHGVLIFTVNDLERDGRIFVGAVENRFKGSKENKLLGVEVTSVNTVSSRRETGCFEDIMVRFTNGSEFRV